MNPSMRSYIFSNGMKSRLHAEKVVVEHDRRLIAIGEGDRLSRIQSVIDSDRPPSLYPPSTPLRIPKNSPPEVTERILWWAVMALLEARHFMEADAAASLNRYVCRRIYQAFVSPILPSDDTAVRVAVAKVIFLVLAIWDSVFTTHVDVRPFSSSSPDETAACTPFFPILELFMGTGHAPPVPCNLVDADSIRLNVRAVRWDYDDPREVRLPSVVRVGGSSLCGDLGMLAVETPEPIGVQAVVAHPVLLFALWKPQTLGGGSYVRVTTTTDYLEGFVQWKSFFYLCTFVFGPRFGWKCMPGRAQSPYPFPPKRVYREILRATSPEY